MDMFSLGEIPAFKAFVPLMIVGFFGAITPGPDMFLTLKTTLRFGALQGFKVLLGIACGWFIYMGLIYAGLIAWLDTPLVQIALSLIGGTYLLYLSFKILIAGNAKYDLHTQNTAKSGFLSGLIINLSNPKAVLFFIFLITPFLDDGTIILSLCLLWISLFSAFMLIILISAFARRFITQGLLNLIDRICGVLFGGFAWLLFFEFGKNIMAML